MRVRECVRGGVGVRECVREGVREEVRQGDSESEGVRE